MGIFNLAQIRVAMASKFHILIKCVCILSESFALALEFRKETGAVTFLSRIKCFFSYDKCT